MLKYINIIQYANMQRGYTPKSHEMYAVLTQKLFQKQNVTLAHTMTYGFYHVTNCLFNTSLQTKIGFSMNLFRSGQIITRKMIDGQKIVYFANQI